MWGGRVRLPLCLVQAIFLLHQLVPERFTLLLYLPVGLQVKVVQHAGPAGGTRAIIFFFYTCE